MEDATDKTSGLGNVSSQHVETGRVDQGIAALSELLGSLAEPVDRSTAPVGTGSELENRLIEVRLGIASSLFTALRCRNAATAAHCMRVSIGCSAWLTAMGAPAVSRDQLEVAALLHDVGKIGVPDHILHKPGDLSAEEAMVMERHRLMGLQILGCCGQATMLEIVKYAPAWFDGSKPGFDRAGKDLPFEARVLAIVDAFDAMTTDHVYRRAMSRERALAELYEFTGKQFDPELVQSFHELHQKNLLDLQSDVSQRWLESLDAGVTNERWSLHLTEEPGEHALPHTLFQQQLLTHMHDGVICVDNQKQIFLWNESMQRLSGISDSAVSQKIFHPSLLALREEDKSLVSEQTCPVTQALESGAQAFGRYTMTGRSKKDTPIDLRAIPVIGRDGTKYGVTVLLDDVSSETSLEQKCQSLHSQATRDPLTQVANRAEFDRVHERFIKAHVESNLPCSLIICDIDRFKQVNDTYGHQAGDDVIRSFAAHLQQHIRHGDLVARYGGEEFVMLCADCNNASAAARAEQIRRSLAEVPHQRMGGRRVTASFGVTENQPGDTPETMLRRADRALLEAKETGRNRVVQLGSGYDGQVNERRRTWWPFGASRTQVILERHLVTNVPLKVAIEKLRGFVADHEAEIVETGEDYVRLTISMAGANERRRVDRPVPLLIELRFSQGEVQLDMPLGRGCTERQARVHVVIRPRRNRDRRLEHLTASAQGVLTSLQSYLMAREQSFDSLEPTPETEPADVSQG